MKKASPHGEAFLAEKYEDLLEIFQNAGEIGILIY